MWYLRVRDVGPKPGSWLGTLIVLAIFAIVVVVFSLLTWHRPKTDTCTARILDDETAAHIAAYKHEAKAVSDAYADAAKVLATCPAAPSQNRAADIAGAQRLARIWATAARTKTWPQRPSTPNVIH